MLTDIPTGATNIVTNTTLYTVLDAEHFTEILPALIGAEMRRVIAFFTNAANLNDAIRANDLHDLTPE